MPVLCYFVCFTPRTGSHLLREALQLTGVAGNSREWFWRANEPAFTEQWGVRNYREYFERAIREGSTPNGVFGAKVSTGEYLDHFARQLRSIGYEGLRLPDLMERAFPNLRYIWTTRRDKIRQAISYARANQTGNYIWEGDTPPVPAKSPEYDFDQIDGLLNDIILREALWQDYFAQAGVTPCTVVYEELTEDYEGTALRVLKYLGLPTENVSFGQRRMKRQGDALNDEWVRRFRREKWPNCNYDEIG